MTSKPAGEFDTNPEICAAMNRMAEELNKMAVGYGDEMPLVILLNLFASGAQTVGWNKLHAQKMLVAVWDGLKFMEENGQL